MLRRIKNLILHRQPAVNNLSSGKWLKGTVKSSQEPVRAAMFSYSTPAVGAAPAAGECVHADNIINKLTVNHIDMTGRDISAALAQLESGDFVSIGGSVRQVIAPLQPATGYTSITIEPDNQLPDGIYPISGWKAG